MHLLLAVSYLMHMVVRLVNALRLTLKHVLYGMFKSLYMLAVLFMPQCTHQAQLLLLQCHISGTLAHALAH
jgi:hypothetical protein